MKYMNLGERNMFSKIFKLIKSFLLISVSDGYKREFDISINRINVTRAKITAITFILLEVIQFIASFIVKNEDFLKRPDIYYGTMYILMIIAMAVFLLLFIKLEKNISENGTSFMVAAVSFISFILIWCAGISLLDQLSYGQIIVYVVAIISIAVTPLFKPVTLFTVYLTIHALFLAFMLYFQKSSEILFGNFLNSTTILIISWVISCMRYKNRVEDFNNRKIIQEKSDELKRVNKELEKLSRTDSLTGIFNRSVFDKTIKTEWDRCKRYFTPLSLIMIDIDFFKAFNDNYGHQAGDECIKQVAWVLSDCAKRSSDIVARYGGEEFAIILPQIEKANALELAEKMRSRVEKLNIPHAYSSISDYVTISLGVYTVTPSDKLSIEEFIRTADKALYDAKKDNRNSIVVA
jgi:diguanylate cyclase (GGDEF)-like protein